MLNMKPELEKELYKWQRGVSGSWHHWDKLVLNGNAVLHVEGSEDIGGYSGKIQLNNVYNPDLNSIFSTNRVPFRLPEYCAQYLENKWSELITKEQKITYIKI
jgi:hypothetical protein